MRIKNDKQDSVMIVQMVKIRRQLSGIKPPSCDCAATVAVVEINFSPFGTVLNFRQSVNPILARLRK